MAIGTGFNPPVFALEFSRFKITQVARDVVKIFIAIAQIVSDAGPFLIQIDGTKANEPNEKVNAMTNLVGEV